MLSLSEASYGIVPERSCPWAKEPLNCLRFTLENAQAPSVFWAFYNKLLKEILDPPGEENERNPKQVTSKRKFVSRQTQL